ncbi:transcriptional regulator, GntR family [Thermosyntropha lipolytica DSM 11003]|uniref:Transcriptional regulator, GntR family n=1 Tax=Thermosyntropha lipolytica DSM 11003 TaxID=1123382 RepID=A0A1M5JQF7_9FIRM|nr:GntR family transcriptional regulator [Thermosyntropha lipolytica]SHG42223.1 transcriptional regulator, GntR family [Thermosyntropha lipolytica DSM 11003]
MDFAADRPIYMQIIEDFKRRMIRGELKTGDKIPSQREYAQMVRVNPNTVQRAYREMENMGLVETLRGQGTFVRVEEEMLMAMKKEMAEEIAERFVREMKDLGFDYEDIKMLVEKFLHKGGQSND